MSLVAYTGAVARPLSDIVGDTVSVLTYGAVGDGTTDDGPAFTTAVAKLTAIGGKKLHIPGGKTYCFKTPAKFVSASNIEVVGDGTSSKIIRSANMPAGQGVFDVAASTNIAFRNFSVDGKVITSVGVQYGSFTGTLGGPNDPMSPTLTENTTFWIHGGSSKILFDGVTLTHSGGYGYLLDATAVGDIDTVTFVNCKHINNRPHLTGTNPADLNYGFWTGGIHYQGDGTNFCVKNLVVTNCTFERNTGNCVWGHLYAFTKMHQNIHVDSNTFLDCGLDAIETGGVLGGSVYGNKIRRVGYICSDDTSASVPKYLPGAFAVGVDTSGLVNGVNYVGNTITSCNGACMDLDGFGLGVVSGNTCRTPRTTDIEYAEDLIATVGWGNSTTAGGPSWEYGCQIGNTSQQATGAFGVTITGNNFINLRGGAVLMYASRDCVASGNTIYHAPLPNRSPIQLGPTGTGSNQRCYGNVVTANNIYYDPATSSAAVFEDGSIAALLSTEVNWVYDNTVLDPSGFSFEFQKDSNSGSIAYTEHSTNANNFNIASPGSSVGIASSHITVREGTAAASTSAYSWYIQEGTAAARLNMRLQGFSRTGTQHPLLNVSDNGVAGTGVFATGNRTQTIFDDCVVTGKVYADGFLAVTDTTYADADANLLPATIALIRWNNSLSQWSQSVSVASGSRVWTPFAASTAVVGSDTWVHYNKTVSSVTSQAADAGLTWSYTSKVLTITGVANTAALLIQTGYVQSNGGYVSNVNSWQGIQSTTDGALLRGYGLAATSASKGGYIDIAPLGYATFPAPLAGLSAFGSTDVLLWAAGANGTPTPNTSVGLNTNAYIDAAAGFVTHSSATNAIQAPNGAVNAKYLVAADSLYFVAASGSGRALSSAGQASSYFDSSTNLLMISQNGGAFVPWVGGGTTGAAAGSNTWVQYNNTGVLGATANFTYNSVAKLLVLLGTANTAVLAVGSGYIQSDQGLYVTASAAPSYQNVQAPTGGVFARSIRASFYTQLGVNAGVPTSSTVTAGDSLEAGAALFDTSVGYARLYDGTNWNRILTGVSVVTSLVLTGTGLSISGSTGALTLQNTGVTFLSGTINQVNVSTSTGAITLSLPQPISTSSAVQFSTVICTGNGSFNSSVTGTTIAFQAGGGNFQVDGQGDISGAGNINMAGSAPYKVSGTLVINSSSQFVGNGVNTPNAGHNASGYNVVISGVQYFGNASMTFQDLAGVTHTVKGGIMIS